MDHQIASTRLVYTVEETAMLLSISRTHAYELVARGVLDHVRLGRRIVIPHRAIDELLGRDSSQPETTSA